MMQIVLTFNEGRFDRLTHEAIIAGHKINEIIVMKYNCTLLFFPKLDKRITKSRIGLVE
jgi:hypothetical protein